MEVEGVGFDDAVRAYRNALLAKARGIVGDAEAEDCVQSALLSVWRRGVIPRSWGAWLFRAVRHEGGMRLRARQRLEKRAGGPIESYEGLIERNQEEASDE